MQRARLLLTQAIRLFGQCATGEHLERIRSLSTGGTQFSVATLAKHQGEWLTLQQMKANAKVFEEGELRQVTKQDLKEGKPVVIGAAIFCIFMYDHVNLRYFVEHAFSAKRKGELRNAYEALKEVSF